MISYIARSSSLGLHLTAVRQTIPSGMRPVALGYDISKKILIDISPETYTNFQAAKRLPEPGALGSRGPRAARSIAGTLPPYLMGRLLGAAK